MKKTRLALQNTILPPYRIEFFRELARSTDFRLTLIVGHAHPSTALESRVSVDGLEIAIVRNLFFRRGSLATLQLGFPRILRALSPDVIIVSLDPRLIYNIWVLFWARRRGIPLITWGHGVRPRGRFVSIYKWMIAQSSAVILYSQAGRRSLAELGVAKEKLFVAWNSIDTHEANRLRIGFWEGPRDRVLYIGRLIPEKKINLLLNAFAKAAPQLPRGTALQIVGDGPSKKDLVSLATTLGVAHQVEFVGAIYDQSELAAQFNRSFVHVSPGYCGLSVVQSLAFGVPVLAAKNEPHSPEVAVLKPGKNAEWFESDNAEDLARKLVMFSDLALASSYGEAGQAEVLRTHSTEAMANVFRDAIAYAMSTVVRRAHISS